MIRKSDRSRSPQGHRHTRCWGGRWRGAGRVCGRRGGAGLQRPHPPAQPSLRPQPWPGGRVSQASPLIPQGFQCQAAIFGPGSRTRSSSLPTKERPLLILACIWDPGQAGPRPEGIYYQEWDGQSWGALCRIACPHPLDFHPQGLKPIVFFN